jgi:uncharacterized protein YbcV (DUF1398 family)
MNALISQLIETQHYALSIHPKVGGFPVMAEVFRKTGILKNRWFIPSCQSTYTMNGGAVVQ